MSSSKRMNLISVLAIIACLIASMLLPISGAETPVVMGYEDRLFDVSRVHTIDISMENWETFIETCENEEYTACDVTVDGETIKNVAIRAKGNTSLSNVSSMNSDRYSFKIEFDHYDSAFSYHGLDKLSLNNVIQDNTFMKDYLTYRMMNEFSVPAPLASFAYITVNGEDWGLYLAVEGVEDAFLLRNYGKSHGELYKPDSMDMGGGRGNGKGFDMSAFEDMIGAEQTAPEGGPPSGFTRRMPNDALGGMPGAISSENQRGGFGGRGSDDVKLVYTDDEFDSYSNIFENAKTDITDADKRRLIDAIKRMNEGDTAAVDAEEVIRYFVVHNFVVNDDSYTGTMIHNYYLYEERGVLSMIPWDYNLAYGTFQGGNASASVNRDIMNPVTGGMNDRPMVAWIFENEAYTEKYRAYFAEFLNSVDAVKIIEDAQALIAPYVEKDPTKFCTYEEFGAGVSALKTFVELRSQSVLNQLIGTNETVNTNGFNASEMGTMGSRGGGQNRQTPDMPNGGMMGNMWIPEMPDAGMSLGDVQFPTFPAGDMQMPEIPAGQMGAMPPDGFAPPGMSGAEIPNEATAPDDSGVQNDQQEVALDADSVKSSGTNANETRSNRTNRTNPTGGTAASNAPGANTGVKTDASGEVLLIASICVLLVSIAIALFIKH